MPGVTDSSARPVARVECRRPQARGGLQGILSACFQGRGFGSRAIDARDYNGVLNRVWRASWSVSFVGLLRSSSYRSDQGEDGESNGQRYYADTHLKCVHQLILLTFTRTSARVGVFPIPG